MSRFLDYGIFVPEGGTADKSQGGNSLAQTTSAATGRWAKVGSKWVKVDSGDEPLSLAAGASDGSEGANPSNLSRSMPSVSALSPSSKTQQQGIPSRGSGDSLTRTDGDASILKEVYGKPYSSEERSDIEAGSGFNSGAYSAIGGSWDTPPTTASDCNDATSDSVPSPGAQSSCPSGAAASSANVDTLEIHNCSNGANVDADAADGAGGGRAGSAGSGGLTVDIASRESPGSTSQTASGEGDNCGSAGGSRSRNSSNAMLTPGISRTYSKEEIVQKFFGEGESAAGAAAATVDGSTSSGALASGSGANAACVGERAKSTEEGRKSKRKSAGNGGSDDGAEDEGGDKPPVETRDVACQWDGSEMGDASDDEDEFPQVELPDTPDCNALTAVLRLYDHARLENKRRGVVSSRPGWGVEENIEKWEGVYLDTDDRIVALDVDGDPENRQAVLIGPLPVEIAAMDHLEQLTMRRHRFKGRIPAELGQLKRITHLNLSNCRLIGFIPPEFGGLPNLVVLNLSWNFLSGELPSELGRLSRLEELLVNSNAFSGAIPPEFGKLRKLQRFNAGHNIGLSGTLPPEMSRMSQLSLLDLRHNKISGRIPPLFGRLTNLQQLWLQDNQLTDEIPAELARLPKLQVLHLSNNKLSGTIPMAIRGHPRYRAFKILPGNFALGERVAPSEKEVEAATRKIPTNAMTHAPSALAQSQRQQAQLKAQQRRESKSMSPAKDEGNRRSTYGAQATTDPQMAEEHAKRRSSSGRASLGRKLRNVKRIMGKRATPPTTPTRSSRSRAGTEDSSRSVSPTTAMGPLALGEGSDSAAGVTMVAQGKAFLEAGAGSRDPLTPSPEEDEEAEAEEEGEQGTEGRRDGGGDEGDGSPNPTASLSTGTGPSSRDSPSSHESKERLGGGRNPPTLHAA